MGHLQGIRRTDYGHLPALVIEMGKQWDAYEEAEKEFEYWRERLLTRAYRLTILTRMIEHYNALVDLLLSHTLPDDEQEILAVEVREMTIALSVEQVCNCCANPHHVRLACEKHSRRKGQAS